MTCNSVLAIALTRQATGDTLTKSPSGSRLFAQFVRTNTQHALNAALAQSIANLEYAGFLRPSTLLVTADNELHLECIRGAWARRVLQAPTGFTLVSIGDVSSMAVAEVPRSQFVSLPQALLQVVATMNTHGQAANPGTIVDGLQVQYSGMQMPAMDVIMASLQSLVTEGQLYCMGDHFFIATPQMVFNMQQQQIQQQLQQQNIQQQRPQFAKPQPMLMNNNAAPYHMSVETVKMPTKRIESAQCTVECQTGDSIVCGVPAYKTSAVSTATATVPTQSTTTSTETAKERSTDTLKHMSIKSRDTKPGFFARLFASSKSRRESSSMTKSQTVDSHMNTRPSSSISDAVPTMPLAMGTFSAQFPPSEWLPDMRAMQMTSGKQQQNQNQQQQVWVDPALFSTEHHAVYQQEPAAPSKQSSTPTRRSKRRETRDTRAIKQRFIKYISSSSECLQYLGTVDPPENLPDGDLYESAGLYGVPAPRVTRERRHRRRTLAAAQRQVNAHCSMSDSEDNLSTVMMNASLDDPERTPIARGGGHRRCLDSTIIIGGRHTSTPTAATNGTPVIQTPIGKAPPPPPGLRRPQSTGIDSALSTSPMGHSDEHSQEDAPYSSWSGSEALKDVTGTEEMENARGVEGLDHTYMNIGSKLRLPTLLSRGDETYYNCASINQQSIEQSIKVGDRTYENMLGDSTHFENITDYMPNDESSYDVRNFISSV